MSQWGSESEGVGACEAARRPERSEEGRGDEREENKARGRRAGLQRGPREEEAAGCRRCMVMGVQWRRMK